MAKLRVVALWSAGVVAAALVALWLTGAGGPVYRWMVRYFAPEVWSAIGTWVTAIIAIVAAAFAWSQVRVARETREEQAQPNVVLYAESTPSHWQFLDVVLKNFGTTPAYNVTVEITPALRESPDNAGDEPLTVSFPDLIRTLAPGQEIRTNWDFAVDRETHNVNMKKLLSENKLTEIEFRKRELTPRHEAVVRYEDSRKKGYKMESTLDFDMLKNTTHVATYTVHDLTNMIEKQNKEMAKIAGHLGGFTQEHKGIWVYGSDADSERQYAKDRHDQTAAKRGAFAERVREAQRRNSSQSEEPPPAGGGGGLKNESTT